jgi:hypothetical protein
MNFNPLISQINFDVSPSDEWTNYFRDSIGKIGKNFFSGSVLAAWVA